MTEALISGELQELTTVIVGIGINTGNVPAGIGDIATSIQEEAGLRGIRNRLAAEVLNQFEEVYLDVLERGEWARVIRYYESRLFITDKEVWVSGINHTYRATVLGIDETGALMVRDEDGEIRHVTTGEIQLEWRNEE